MALIFKKKRNGITTVSSSHYETMKEVSNFKMKDDYNAIYKSFRDHARAYDEIQKLKVSAAVTQIIAWREGTREISAFIDSLKPGQLESYEPLYIGSEVQECTDEELQEMMDAYEYNKANHLDGAGRPLD